MVELLAAPWGKNLQISSPIHNAFNTKFEYIDLNAQNSFYVTLAKIANITSPTSLVI